MVEALGLRVVDEDEVGVALEGCGRQVELRFPVDRASGFQAIFGWLAVEEALGVGRLDQPPEDQFILIPVVS